MSALTEFLYPPPAKRKAGSILRWWENRRLAYNVVVGSTGLLSVAFIYVVNLLPPNGFVTPFFWPAIVVFGVMANVCYFFGPAAEVLIEKLWGPRVLPTGPALFRIGLTFSVGLALFPALITTFVWVFRIVASIF